MTKQQHILLNCSARFCFIKSKIIALKKACTIHNTNFS